MDIFNRLTATFLLVTSFSCCYLNAQKPKVKFAISHCNDISGQVAPFEQGIKDFSVPPAQECIQRENHNCTGGFANLVHWLYEKEPFGFNEVVPENNLILSSGNFIAGETGWISADWANGWTNFGKLIKDYVKPTFLSLGIKEFSNGLKQTNSYVDTLLSQDPYLKHNVSVGLGNTCSVSYNETDSPTEAGLCKNLTTSFKTIGLTQSDSVLPYNIGIIGFITPDVERLSTPGKLEFSGVAAAIRDKINKDSDSKDIKTFISVGDGSLELAKQIIDQVDKVKLVIYGQAFSPSKIDKYPLPYNSGLIATAGRYGSSVGKMVLEIDTETGSITTVSGTQQVTDHPGVLNKEGGVAYEKSKDWIKIVQDRKTSVQSRVGSTSVDLVGGKDTCWRGECNLGNIMTDAMVHCVLKNTFYEKPFQYPLHSIWHSGSFSEDTLKGKIFQFYLHKLYPYHNDIHLVKVTGRNLKLVFQKSAIGIDRDWGQFLQVSNGLEVHYDTTSDEPKVTKIRITRDDYGIPRLGDIEDDETYYFVISTFIREGRGLYNIEGNIWEDLADTTNNCNLAYIMYTSFVRSLNENGNNILSELVFDDVCLENYIKSLSYISVGGEERIWINGESGGGPDGHSPCNTRKTAVTVTLTIVYFSIFVGVVYVGYFYVIPRLRRPAIPLEVRYPSNQL